MKQYSDYYDAVYDDETDEWLEDKCDDPTCEFCTQRPARPSDAGLLAKAPSEQGSSDGRFVGIQRSIYAK